MQLERSIRMYSSGGEPYTKIKAQMGFYFFEEIDLNFLKTKG